MAWHDKISEPIHRILARPQEEATRFQRSVQFAVVLARHCWKQLWEDRAPEMAAALTYRTIFGLVPFLVLALLVFRAFGGFQEVGLQIQEMIYENLGLSTIHIRQAQAQEDVENQQLVTTPEIEQKAEQVAAQAAAEAAAEEDATAAAERDDAAIADAQVDAAPTPDTTAAAAPSTPEEEAKLRQSVEDVLNNLNQQVAQVSFKSIGAVGLVLLIWAALALVATVEDSFNTVYRAPRGRPYHMRIAIYWAAITLGPVLIMLSMWLTGQVTDWATSIAEFGGVLPAEGADDPAAVPSLLITFGAAVLAVLSRLAAFLATWVLVFLLYVLMPNTSVRLRAAIIGSFVAALLWEAAKAAFAFYLERAVGYSALYGSLGLIPLFLFWLYLTWLIILFGLELTYTLQHLRGKRLLEKTEDRDILFDPRWMIPVMAIIGEAFNRGKAVALDDIAIRTDLPLRAVNHLAQHLEKENLLHRVQPRNGAAVGYTLAQPPDRIQIARLLDIGETLALSKQSARKLPGRDMLAELEVAQHKAAENLTLARLID